MSELGSLTIFPGTPAQVLESRRRTFEEWGSTMTEEEYLQRDAILDQRENAANGRLVTWVLCPHDDAKTLEFRASCETFQREGLFLRRSSPSDVQEVPCYGIASVFVPARFRKRGYAKHMLRLLHWAIGDGFGEESAEHEFPENWTRPRPPHIPRGSFSTLWSDVGRFYESCGPTANSEGWVVDGPFSTTWDVKSVEEEGDGIGKWQWLSAIEVLGMWDAEKEVMKEDMKTAIRDSYPGHDAAFTFLPGKGVEAFQRDRRQHVLQRLGISLDNCAGAALNNGKDGLVAWTVEEKPVPTLLITRIRLGDVREFSEMLQMLVKTAKRLSLESIEIWNLPVNLSEAANGSGAVKAERADSEHLPSRKWYGDEKRILWCNNERFAWC